MADDIKTSIGTKPADTIDSGKAQSTAERASNNNKEEISQLDRWKNHLDTRKQYVEYEFRTSQDFDKIMLTWPAALIAGSLTIFWHINGTVYWMTCLYGSWFFEFSALALMLGSMVTRQLLYRRLIADHDDNYKEYLAGNVSAPFDNPWKQKTQLAEWLSIVGLIVGAIFLFAFRITNAPSSIATKPSGPTAQTP